MSTTPQDPRIIKSTEAMTVEHPVFLIFGEPGICKSSLAYSAKDPLLLDADRGAHRAANRRDTWPIACWSDVTALMEQPDILAPYATIVPDTIGRILDFMTQDIVETDPKKAPGGNLSQQGWGVLKSRFQQWMGRVRGLGKDMLLTAHHKEERDGDLRIMRPDIQGGSLSEVLKSADFIGYIYMSGKDRMIDFNPTDRWVGKNPAGWKPKRIPSVDKAGSFMAELMAEGREALGKVSQASAALAQQLDQWRAQIDTFQTAHEFNRAIPDIANVTLTLRPQVEKLFGDRARALKLGWDKAGKQFLPPAAETKSEYDFAGRAR